MKLNRREFVKGSALASGSLLGASCATADAGVKIKNSESLKLKIFATNWGFQGSMQEFCKKSKDEGYDGVEIWVPGKQEDRDVFFNAVAKNNLEYGFLAGNSGSGFEAHWDSFQMQVERAVALKPAFVNCHSGKDFFTQAQSDQFINFTLKKSKEHNVSIYHETHRARILYAAHVAKDFIGRFPEMKLTLDISHWCCVAGSMLADQEEAVNLALASTAHIHSRIGFSNGPQIPEPRAPEWKSEVDAHFAWWDKVVEIKKKKGELLTMTTEFGPSSYMWTLPYTKQPVANLWDVNAYMMREWRKRYQS